MNNQQMVIILHDSPSNDFLREHKAVKKFETSLQLLRDAHSGNIGNFLAVPTDKLDVILSILKFFDIEPMKLPQRLDVDDLMWRQLTQGINIITDDALTLKVETLNVDSKALQGTIDINAMSDEEMGVIE